MGFFVPTLTLAFIADDTGEMSSHSDVSPSSSFAYHLKVEPTEAVR